MRLLATTLLLLLAAVAGPAHAQDDDDAEPKRSTLTVTTSLGPITDDGNRNLRARGKAPVGSKVTVQFFRGNKRIAVRRAKVRDGSYKAWKAIDRTGSYRVKVKAKTRAGSTIVVTARLKYGPKAEAPTAPDPED